jgi:hypothetical protein
MSFAGEIRRAVMASPRMKLPEIREALWRSWGQGLVGDDDAQALADMIETRMALPVPKPAPRRAGSRPRSPASMERRRTWAASGRLPPQIASRFTQGEVAALAVVAAHVEKHGDCRLAIDHIGALAGVGRSTVKRALREAQALGFIHVVERRLTGFRNDTNVMTIIASVWLSWLRLRSRRGGVQSGTGTNTRFKKQTTFSPAMTGYKAVGGRQAGADCAQTIEKPPAALCGWQNRLRGS